MLLRKPRSYAEVYNDLDGEIVNLFRVARDHGDALRRVLELTPFARSEFVASYKAAVDPLEQARRTLVRSFMGFGSAAICGEVSGFRANSNRSGTTPARDWRNYPNCLAVLIERLRGVVIEQRDALAVMQHHDAPTTLHYVDPPYVHATRSAKVRRKVGGGMSRKAYRHEMTDADHEALAAGLQPLQGMVLLSGYRCDLYDRLYRDWERRDVKANADGAVQRVESLWLNAAAAARAKGNGQLFEAAA